MLAPVQLRYDKLGLKVVKALQGRHFDAYYFSNPQEAVEKVFSLIPQTDVVSWGGSLTVTGLDITKIVTERGYKVIDRDKAGSPEERVQLTRQAMLCDTYITGTNAIT